MKTYNLVIKNTLTGEIRSITRRLSEEHKESLLKHLFNPKTGMALIKIDEIDD